MYFSEIRMRPGREREATHQRLDAPGDDHHWIWRWFDAPAGAPRDFLFRRHSVHWPVGGYTAPSGIDELPIYLAVSQRPPRAELDGWVSRCRTFDPRVEAGAQLDFQLRANPTVRRSPLRHEPRPAGVPRHAPRHDVVMDARRKWSMAHEGGGAGTAVDAQPATAALVYDAGFAWLERQGERHGFRVERDSLRIEDYRRHRMRPARAFSSLEFEGRLEVRDPPAFREALLHGIGSGRAFGCGLLVVRRAS